MKSKFKPLRRMLSLLLCVLLLGGVFCVALQPVASAASAFEKSISAFPESYRVELRALHKAHPNWEFTAMQTGLNWDDVIAAESAGNRSLVPASTNYANIFKSKAVGDFNYNTGTYIQKDGGFVNASKYAVAFFMDPRNFLNEENIFQFESLNFDASFDIDAIEVILSGSFMYRTKISYLTSSGERKNTDETYAEVIYLAGKTYNVNPCYLAAKIRHEIGSTPSGSVTGTNSTYPGIYNFYNIGASDGQGAITRGLAWAANTSSGTYHRPWNSPRKSIIGGAQYIASTYIAKGQQTSYLQRFNVNPDCTYQTYEHQYMTNVCGAAAQAYSTYLSYLSIGLIDNRFIFSIPVYQGMTGQNDNSGTLTMKDAANQSAILGVTINSNVRTGPSVNYSTLGVQLSPGDAVTILDEVKTESHYYDSILKYPNWYKVKFSKNGQSYTGWVPAGFFDITTKKKVGLGMYTPKTTTTNPSLKFKYVSMDPRYATIVDDVRINFIAKGTVNILGYDSTGRYAVVKYDVSSGIVNDDPEPTEPVEPTEPPAPTVDTSVGTPTGLSSSDSKLSSFTLSWNSVSGANGYRVYLLDTTKNTYQSLGTTQKTSFVVSGLSAGTVANVKVKAYRTVEGKTYWGTASAPLTAATRPAAPKTLKQSASTSTSVKLKWSSVNGATEYAVFQMQNDGSFKMILSAKKTSVSVTGLSPNCAYTFKVRPLLSVGGIGIAGTDSQTCTARTGPAVIKTLKQTDTDSTSYTLTWTPVDGATGYKLYCLNETTFRYVLVATTKKTSYTVKNQAPGQFAAYTVKPYQKLSGETYYGSASADFAASTAPAKVKKLKVRDVTANTVDLKWNPVENASGYCVYLVKSNGRVKRVAKVEDRFATISGLTTGKKVTFRVRAFIRCGKAVFWGAYSADITAKPETNDFVMIP